MSTELLLAAYLVAVGLAVAGVATHFYQSVWRQPAILRFDGSTTAGMFGHLVMSFVCGPYIMLRMGAMTEKDGTVSAANLLVGAAVALGWAFITGLLFVGAYVAAMGI